MIDINKEATKIVKEVLNSYGIKKKIEFTIIDKTREGALGVEFGKYIPDFGKIGDSDKKRYDYCLLNNKGTPQTKVRFSVVANTLSSAINDIGYSILDDVTYALKDVMKMHYDSLYNKDNQESITLEV